MDSFYMPETTDMDVQHHGSTPSRPLTMAFVACQEEITDTYETGEALRNGTLFPELDKPFTGRREVLI